MCGTGHRTTDRHNHREVAQSPMELERPQTATKPCPQCGAQVEQDFVFCPRCGAELLTACPECHRAVETDWTRCAYCGAELVAA
ncbi:MAG: zinc-ribbon domain-containing protein [Anaerolineales bacterium]